MKYEPAPIIQQAQDTYLTRHTSDSRPEDYENGETTACEKCGHAIHIGEYPFCPHGYGSLLTVGDSIPGGLWIEHGLCNIDGTPRRYDSHSEIAAEAKKRGLTNVVTHIPGQDGDKNRHTTRHI